MIDRRVLPRYEHLLKAALAAACSELCELYLNQARGMAEYAMLTRDLSGMEFEREMQRQTQVRVTREMRGPQGEAA